MGFSFMSKGGLMFMATKISDYPIKTKVNKQRKVKDLSVLVVKKEKNPSGKRHDCPQAKEDKKSSLFKRAIILAAIIVFIAMVYVRVEGQAQEEPQSQEQSWMQALYEEIPAEAIAYDKKQAVSDILSANGVEAQFCWAIAEAIVEESNKTNIDVEMFLAIIHKESEFRSNAVSSAYAKGIMQIQTGTWDAYVKKHNLPVKRRDIFLPQANIMVASVILKELYDYYAKFGYQEPVIWNHVLAAYYAGPASVRDGIKDYHWQYIRKVKKYYSMYESQITT
jgi:soluble lytic murein transglycosylase-like protein